MFLNPILGQSDVKDAIDNAMTAFDHEYTGYSGVFFETSAQFGGLPNVVDLGDYDDGNNNVDDVSWRAAVDAKLEKYRLSNPYWIGFTRSKNFKDWLNYLQWLCVTATEGNTTLINAIFGVKTTVDDKTTAEFSIAVIMFKDIMEYEDFIATHVGKDYRFDETLGTKAWRATLQSNVGAVRARNVF